MSAFIESMITRAQTSRQTIVLPEGNDQRTLQAAKAVMERGIADVIVLGNATEITSTAGDLAGARIVDPATSNAASSYAEAFFELRKHKGITLEDATAQMADPIYFGAMMVKQGDADGMVCGACHATADVLRAALQILKTAPGASAVSSFFIMALPDTTYGDDGVLMFADCGLTIQPDAAALAQIAVSCSESWHALFESEPRVALLSHSTHTSAVANPDRDKVIEATRLAHEMAPNLALDGELQADAALVPAVAATKAADSSVAGKANILVFPDLDSGNIAYKLVQRLTHAEAYGPITQGIAAPVNDLSRGASVEDIIGVIAITAVQCQATERV